MKGMGKAQSYFRRAAFLAVLAYSPLALAEIIVAGPDECPVAADLPSYQPSSDIEAADFNVWRDAASGRPVIIDVPVDGPSSDAYIFQRYYADPATGEVFANEPALCGDAVFEASGQ